MTRLIIFYIAIISKGKILTCVVLDDCWVISSIDSIELLGKKTKVIGN